MSPVEPASESEIPELREIYIAELREHALTLVWMGYQRMASGGFATAEEDDITGELMRQMKSVLEDPNAPAWSELYSVAEQVRSDVAGKLGKRRPIVDVEFERHLRGPRPRLRFEAKRLGRGSGVGDYLGAEGLGAFLFGHYSTTHQEAGMLGYVQSGSGDAWATKISTELKNDRQRYLLVDQGAWQRLVFAPLPPHLYCSEHLDERKRPLLIVHLLLPFTKEAG